MPAKRKKTTLALPSRSPSNGRFFELDFIRGVLMFLLLAYHMAYTLGSTHQFFRFVGTGSEPSWILGSTAFWHGLWYSEPLLIFQLLASSFFLFLCGVSCGFSRHNAKRGYGLLLLAMIETIFLEALSHYVGIEANVYIGLLHAIGIAVLFYALVDRFFPSLWVDLGCGIAFSLLFALFYNHGIMYDPSGLPLNPLFYATPREAVSHLGELFVGYATAGIDSWSPLRVGAFVFLGAAASKALYQRKTGLWQPKNAVWAAPITFLGRHSLLVYLAEQVVVLAIMWCVLAPFGYTF